MKHRMAKWCSLALACFLVFGASGSVLAETDVEMYDNAEPCYTCEFEIELDDSFEKPSNAWVYELSDNGRLACKFEVYYPLTWSSLQNMKVSLGNGVFAEIFGNQYNTRIHRFDNTMIVQDGQIVENPDYQAGDDFLMFEMTREDGVKGEPSITMFTQLGEWDIENGYTMTSSVVAMVPGTFRETVADEDMVKKIYGDTATLQYPATADESDTATEEPENTERVWPEWNILQREEYDRVVITDTSAMPEELDVPYQAEFDIVVSGEKNEDTWLYALSDNGNVHVTIQEVANVPQCSVLLKLEGKYTIEMLNLFPNENDIPGFRTFDINKKVVEGTDINTYASNTALGRICANFVKRHDETTILLIPDDGDIIEPVSGTFRESGTSETLFSKYDVSTGKPDPTKDWEESKYLYNYYIDEDGIHHSFGTLRGDYYEDSLRDFEIVATAEFEVPSNTPLLKNLSTEDAVHCTYYDINVFVDDRLMHQGYFLLKAEGNKGTQWFINGDYYIRRPENEISDNAVLKNDNSIFMEFMPITFLDGYDYEIYNSIEDNVYMQFNFSDNTKKYMTDIDVNFEDETTNIPMQNIDYKGFFMQRFMKMVYADTWQDVCKEVGLNQ